MTIVLSLANKDISHLPEDALDFGSIALQLLRLSMLRLIIAALIVLNASNCAISWFFL